MSNISIITKNGQITIPIELRKKFNLKSGIKVVFIETDEGIIIKQVSNEMGKLHGILEEEIDMNKAKKTIKSIRDDWSL